MESESIPRFRFTLQPATALHVNELRQALFSWALSRALHGDLILYVADVDTPAATTAAAQMKALTRLGIDWDEGPDVGGEYAPYRQSARAAAHQRAVTRLVESGHAYTGVDPDHPAKGLPRLRLPRTGAITLRDLRDGSVSVMMAGQEDPILVDENGRFHPALTTAAADHEMGITHVVRSAAQQQTSAISTQICRALGWAEPHWTHLPPVRNRQGEPLGRRDADGGYLLADLEAAGYLPPALFHYLLLLGWTPTAAPEFIDKWFVRRYLRPDQLSVAPVTFDWKRLNRVNRRYLQRLSDARLAEAIRPFLEEAYGPLPDDKWLTRLTATVRGDLARLEEVVDVAGWAFADGYELRPRGAAALQKETAVPVLTRLVAELAAIVLLDEATGHAILTGLTGRLHAAHGWAASDVNAPIQAALTGDTAGPPLTAVMSLLGKQRSLQRVADALKYRS